MNDLTPPAALDPTPAPAAVPVRLREDLIHTDPLLDCLPVQPAHLDQAVEQRVGMDQVFAQAHRRRRNSCRHERAGRGDVVHVPVT